MNREPCKFEELAHLYPTGTLTPQETGVIEKHMKECASCRRAAGEAQEIREAAAAMIRQAPAGLNERIMAGIRERQAAEESPNPWAFANRWQRALAPIAAAACLALLITVGVTTPNRAPAASGTATQSTARLDAETPSEYIVLSALDSSEQKYLAEDSASALQSYYNDLMGSD